MFTEVHPKLPMRNKAVTREYYINKLGFTELGSTDYPEYLMVKKDEIELHFFLFKDLNPLKNYGQIYIRTTDIKMLYQHLQQQHVEIHPNAPLTLMEWGQWEFALLDPDKNLLTFGQQA